MKTTTPETTQQHTPGSWRAVGKHIWSDTRCLCTVRPRGQTDVFKDENEANARLIAAAPELLSALIILLKMVEDGDFTTVELDEARAAIAKPLSRPGE